MKAPAKNKTMEPLDFLIGTWTTTGKIKAGAGQKTASMNGTDSYELVLEGAFLLHTVRMRMGKKKVEAMELISYDAATDSYPMHAFDNEGKMVEMETRVVKKGVLHIIGNGMRAQLKEDLKKGTMKARWERSLDGWTWKPWMDMQFNRKRS